MKSIYKGLIIGFLMSIVVFTIIIIIVNITSSYSTSDALSRASELYVSFLNYGSIDNEPLIIRVAISFLGVLFIGFLSAYITINFLIRKKLKMGKHIKLIKNGKDYWIKFTLVNNGAEINSVEMSFVSYINDKVRDLSNKLFQNPYIPSKNKWEIQAPIQRGSFFLNLLRDFEYYNCKLYIIIKYNDSNTGQKFTNLYPFTKDNIIWSNDPFEHSVMGYAKNKKHITDEHLIIINKTIENRTRILRMDEAISIGKATDISFHHFTADQKLTSEYPYLQLYDSFIEVNIYWPKKGKSDKFSMVLFKFTPPEDWRFFYNRNGRIKFTVLCNNNLRGIWFELKALEKVGSSKSVDEMIPVVLKKEIECNEIPADFTIPLNPMVSHIDHLKEVVELCFVVRKDQIKDKRKKACFYITSLVIDFDD